MENKDINIPKNSDIFTIQFPSKYPIALIQTRHQSLTSLYKNSVDISAQNTRMTLSLVTSNLLNTFQHPEETEETTLTIIETEKVKNYQDKDISTPHTDPNSTAINLGYSIPWENRLASIAEVKISKENLNNIATQLIMIINHFFKICNTLSSNIFLIN